MKVIITGDWHADAQIAGRRRVDEVAAAVRAVVARAVELDEAGEAVGVVVLGDMSDPDSPRCWSALAVVAEAMRALDDNEIPSLWLTGNHDVVDDGHGSHCLQPLAPLLRSGDVVGVPGIHFLGPWRDGVLCLPYTPRDRTYDPRVVVPELAQRCAEEGVRVSAVVGHLMIEGIGPGSESDEFARGKDVFLPLEELAACFPGVPVFNGHYHRRQTYRGVEIPGSLVRLTLGEISNRPVWVEATL